MASLIIVVSYSKNFFNIIKFIQCQIFQLHYKYQLIFQDSHKLYAMFCCFFWYGFYLQYCVGFKRTAKWFSYIHIYIFSGYFPLQGCFNTLWFCSASLMTSNVEDLFMCSLVFWIISQEKCVSSHLLIFELGWPLIYLC